MKTVGVDLAAEPKKTAVAVVEWDDGRAVVEQIALGQTDADILSVANDAAKVGIDCPLGWPEPFIDFLVAHRDAATQDAAAMPETDLAGRRRLAYRTTDLVLKEETGVLPLSVAADLIGHTAMRVAGILAALAAQGHSVDRAGSGLVVEAYPAAALRFWTLYRPRYKGPGSAAVRAQLLADLLVAMPALRLGVDQIALCQRSDDALDAVLCALIARAAWLGQVRRPDQDQEAAVATEGWIVVPTCGLAELTDY